MNSSKQEEITKWISPLLDDLLFKEYQVHVSGSSEKGDGYLGDITFVKASGTLISGEEKTYDFVIKSGKRSSQLRKKLPIKAAFENEINVYEKVFPLLKQYQHEKMVKDPFDNVPKCYQTKIFENVEVLILENMKNLEFSLWNRTKPMNRQHIEEVLKCYAKLHAISFALRDQNPERFKEVVSSLKDVYKLFYEVSQTEENPQNFREIIDLAKELGELEIEKKLLEAEKDTKRLNLCFDFDDPFTVIVHGDCWNNNFLFNYQSHQIKVCVIDWQMTRLGSPILDLSYFLFTCISEEDLEEFDEIINFYYSHLSTFLQELGGDLTIQFPFNEFMNHWKKYAIFGISLMPILLKICLSEQDEVIDLTDIIESNKALSEAFSFIPNNKGEFQRRALAIIKFAIERKFI